MIPWWGWMLVIGGGAWLLSKAGPTVGSTVGGTKALFLHRSVGTGMLQQGLRQLVVPSLALWDHGYSYEGLTDAAGVKQEKAWLAADNWTDTDELLKLFGTTELAALRQAVLAYPFVVVKSCFTNDFGTLAQAQAMYLQLRAAWAALPNTFVLITQPPLHRLDGETPSPAAARALASWLASPAFLGGAPNVFVIDLFDVLAEPVGSLNANRLRWDYETTHEDWDSHPNAAGYAAGAKFVAAALLDIASKRPGAVGSW